jgi:hypothetical protein
MGAVAGLTQIYWRTECRLKGNPSTDNHNCTAIAIVMVLSCSTTSGRGLPVRNDGDSGEPE